MKPPWLEKIETSHSHLKAFLAPPVPQEALRNMDMVLAQLNKAYEVIELYVLPSLVAHGIDAGLDMETIKSRTAYRVCAEFLNYNPEVS